MHEPRIPTRNSKLLQQFAAYCRDHPDERFWQALRNWSGCGFILAADYSNKFPNKFWDNESDTFHWEGRNE